MYANSEKNLSVAFPRRQTGISLVEILVSLVAGMILIGGVGEVYVFNKLSYRVQENQARLQENARYAMEILSRNTRNSGYQGCRPLTQVAPNTVAAAPIIPLSAGTALSGNEGLEGSWSPAVSATLAGIGNLAARTDTLTVQYGEPCNGRLHAAMAATDSNVSIAAGNACNFAAGDVVLISSCTRADIFRASSVSVDLGTGAETLAHDDSVNGSADLSTAYGTDAEVLRFRSYTYYVGNDAAGRPVLWQLDNTRATSTTAGAENPVEMMEDVENMQVAYGIDTDGDGSANQYVKADAVADWSTVRSVRLRLLVRSPDDNITSTAQTYVFDGAGVTATDRHLRREFTATLGLRNRLQ